MTSSRRALCAAAFLAPVGLFLLTTPSSALGRHWTLDISHPWDHDPYLQGVTAVDYTVGTQIHRLRVSLLTQLVTADKPYVLVSGATYHLRVDNYTDTDGATPQIALRFYYGFQHNDTATLKHFNRHNLGEDPDSYISSSNPQSYNGYTTFDLKVGARLPQKLQALSGDRKLYIAAYEVGGGSNEQNLTTYTVILAGEIPQTYYYQLDNFRHLSVKKKP